MQAERHLIELKNALLFNNFKSFIFHYIAHELDKISNILSLRGDTVCFYTINFTCVCYVCKTTTADMTAKNSYWVKL